MPWTIKPSLMAISVKRKQEKRLNKVGDFLFKRLVSASPVDSGRFRGEWRKEGNYPLVSLTNNARSDAGFPYPLLLEEGSSPQAPHGVVRVNVSSLKVLMDQGVL